MEIWCEAVKVATLQHVRTNYSKTPHSRIMWATSFLHSKLRKILIGVCTKINLKITAVITNTYIHSALKPNYFLFIFIFLYQFLGHKTNNTWKTN
jgi:hypothetical protein